MVLIASFSLIGDAAADDRTFSAASGEPTIIGRHVQWRSKDCGPNGLPGIKVKQQPAHGTTNVTVGANTIGINRTNPGQDQCRGKEMTGVILNYQPKPGFVGTDTVNYTVAFNNGSEVIYKVTINVLPSQVASSEQPEKI